MSKAFLRDFEDIQETVVPTPVSALPPGARNYMTLQGAARLREELRRLRMQERPTLAERAASDPEANASLAALDQRIRYLQQSLFGAEIVPLTPGPTDVVRFGTSVTVRERGGATTEYRLVGVDEADPAHGIVSWVSPLAQALMNAHVGDRVRLNTPAGSQELTITRIRYTAPDEG